MGKSIFGPEWQAKKKAEEDARVAAGGSSEYCKCGVHLTGEKNEGWQLKMCACLGPTPEYILRSPGLTMRNVVDNCMCYAVDCAHVADPGCFGISCICGNLRRNLCCCCGVFGTVRRLWGRKCAKEYARLDEADQEEVSGLATVLFLAACMTIYKFFDGLYESVLAWFPGTACSAITEWRSTCRGAAHGCKVTTSTESNAPVYTACNDASSYVWEGECHTCYDDADCDGCTDAEATGATLGANIARAANPPPEWAEWRAGGCDCRNADPAGEDLGAGCARHWICVDDEDAQADGGSLSGATTLAVADSITAADAAALAVCFAGLAVLYAVYRRRHQFSRPAEAAKDDDAEERSVLSASV